MDENQIRAIVREELSNFNPPKKKRAPSKWQNFLKDCAKRQPEELVYTDKVKLCSIEYQDLKNNGGLNGSSQNNQNDNNNHTQNISQKEQRPDKHHANQSKEPVHQRDQIAR